MTVVEPSGSSDIISVKFYGVVTLFARPAGTPQPLPSAPLLESWEAAGHPDQRRLSAYLDEVEPIVGAQAPAGDQLALELTVGLPRGTDLTRGGRDLDNYLFPIARRIGHRRLDAAFARKLHAAVSTIAACRATRMPDPPDEPCLRVRTTASSASIAWKQQVNAACQVAAAVRPLTGGPVELCIRFGVASGRNWTTLWKPAIDALGPALGVADARRPFHPDDDRVVDLALHRHVDDTLGYAVDIAAWWRPSRRAVSR
jgi:hypothetical protein